MFLNSTLFSLKRQTRFFKEEQKSVLIHEDPALAQERAFYESSLLEFGKAAWHAIKGKKPFVNNWHQEALTYHLELCYDGEISTFVANYPPRCTKTTFTSVMFPAWCWTKNPSLQFICISYGADLARRDSIDCRRLIESPWYQRLWGHKVRLLRDVNTQMRFGNRAGGFRVSTSVGGKGTGENCDIMIVDDANNAGDVQSEAKRNATNDWFDHTASSRFNDLDNPCLINIQQRTHFQDYSGHLLSKYDEDDEMNTDEQEVVHLYLPMRFEKHRKCSTIFLPQIGKIWEDPRKEEGELLWPQRITLKGVRRLEKKLGSEYIISGQLQQNPTPASGGIFKRHFFQMWKHESPPPFKFVLQSWDTAYGVPDAGRDKSNAAWSACTTWGVFEYKRVNQVMLLSSWKGKFEFAELHNMFIRLAKNYYDTIFEKPRQENYKPDLILVENKANAPVLLQILRDTGIMFHKFDPNRYGDKITRARLISHYFECGRVWCPGQPPHYERFRPVAEEFIESATRFPMDENSKDLIDSTSQAFIRLKNSGLISHVDDELVEDSIKDIMQKGQRIYNMQKSGRF